MAIVNHYGHSDSLRQRVWRCCFSWGQMAANCPKDHVCKDLLRPLQGTLGQINRFDFCPWRPGLQILPWFVELGPRHLGLPVAETIGHFLRVTQPGATTFACHLGWQYGDALHTARRRCAWWAPRLLRSRGVLVEVFFLRTVVWQLYCALVLRGCNCSAVLLLGSSHTTSLTLRLTRSPDHKKWQLTLSKWFQTSWRTPLNSDGLGAASCTVTQVLRRFWSVLHKEGDVALVRRSGVTAPLRTNIVPLAAVGNPPPFRPPPLKKSPCSDEIVFWVDFFGWMFLLWSLASQWSDRGKSLPRGKNRPTIASRQK